MTNKFKRLKVFAQLKAMIYKLFYEVDIGLFTDPEDITYVDRWEID